jgi:hypothetical protein
MLSTMKKVLGVEAISCAVQKRRAAHKCDVGMVRVEMLYNVVNVVAVTVSMSCQPFIYTVIVESAKAPDESCYLCDWKHCGHGLAQNPPPANQHSKSTLNGDTAIGMEEIVSVFASLLDGLVRRCHI